MVAAWLVGLVLLGAGLVPPDPSPAAEGDAVRGALAFAEARASGDVTVTAEGGALFSFGPYRASLDSEHLRVTVVEKRMHERGVHSGVSNPVVTDYHSRTTTAFEHNTLLLTGARLQVEGTSQGFLLAHGQPDHATFWTRTASVQVEALEDRLMVWEPATEVKYQYVLPSPLLGVAKAGGQRGHADGGSAAPTSPSSPSEGIVDGMTLPGLSQSTTYTFTAPLPQFPRSTLSDLEAAGDLQIVIHHATVEVAADQGSFTWVAEQTEREHYDVDLGGPGVERSEYFDRYVVLSGLGKLTLDPGDAEAGVAGHRLRYDIDGTLAVREADGAVAAQPLRNATLVGQGRFVLEAAPDVPPGWIQEPRVWTPTADVRSATAPPRPDVRSSASMEGEADALAADGRTLLRPAPPLVTNEASQAAGLLVLAGALLHKLAAFLSPFYIANPLQHQGRRTLFEAVQSRRMVHLRELRRMTGLPIGTLVYHVEVLRRFGLIATVRLPHQLVVFLPKASVTQSQMRGLAVLAHPTRERIGTLFAAGGVFTQKDIASAARVSLAAASRQLGRLERAGLVERIGLRNGQYRASPLLRFWYAGRPAAVVNAAPGVADTC